MKISEKLSWLPILALVLAASGCAVFRPTDPYAGVTGHSQRGAAGEGDGQSNPRPTAGKISLDEAVRIALANNPELAAVTCDMNAAEAQRDLARRQWIPSLYASGGYNRYLDSQRVLAPRQNGEAGVFSRGLFVGDLVLTMPIFTGGRISSEIRAAELLEKAAGHRLARTREELVFNVSSVFYGILAQREVIAALEFSQKTLQEHLQRVQDLIAAQKAAKVDRLRTEVRLADLEEQLAREQNVLAVQARLLTNLLGFDCPGKPVEPAGKLEFNKITIPEAAQALSRACQGRADYLAARAALEAQARAVDAARAGYWPTLSFRGTYGGRWAAGTTDQPAGADSSGDAGQVGIVLDTPIFEGGRIAARVRIEKARLQAAQERLRRLELQIQLDVETAGLNISSAAQRVEATAKTIEHAKESLRIEREKYDVGKGAIVDVLDAQSSLLDSQTNYYRALADYNVALAQYRLATGGPVE